MHSFQIAIVSTEAAYNQKMALLDTLKPVISWLGQGWSLVPEPSEANLLIVLTEDHSGGLTLWQTWRNRFSSAKMVACAKNLFPVEAKWRLPWHEDNQTAATIRIFNLLCQLAESLSSEKFKVPTEVFKPHEYLQGILTESLEDGINRVIALPGGPELYLHPKSGKAYGMDDIDRFIPLFLAPRNSISINVVSDDELHQKVNYANFSSRLSKYAAVAESIDFMNGTTPHKTQEYSFEEVLWLATLVNSQGRWWAAWPFNEQNRIMDWPAFTTAPPHRDYLQTDELTEISRPTMRDIIAKTTLSKRQLVDLNNACAMLGLLESHESAKQHPVCYRLAQEAIHRALKPVSNDKSGRIKIIISGPVGAGKTTAIKILNKCSIISTENHAPGKSPALKSVETDRLDHGEIRFKDLLIQIYGTPDQRRYGFIGDILCKNAWGLLILVNHTGNNPIDELDYYLGCYEPHLPGLRVAIGVTGHPTGTGAGLDEYLNYLQRRGLRYPLVSVDPGSPLEMAGLLTRLAENEGS